MTASRPPAAFEGELSFFSLPELIQLVCTGGHDSDIDIIADGTRAGNLLIRAGRVFRCTHAGMTGEAAFFQLARLRTGRFRVTPLPSEGGNDNSLLNYSWQELLIEAARREDEAKRIAEGAPPAGKQPETKRANRPNEDYVDLFNSTPPPPPPALPRSDIYERVEERGQITPFPRKPVDDLIEDTFVSSSDLGAPLEPITSPTAPISSSKPAIPPSKPDSAGGARPVRPNPAFIPEPPRSRPMLDSSPESVAPLSLAPSSMKTPPEKSEGSRFAQLIQDATAAYLRRDYEMALRLFEECLTIDPSDRRVQHNIERIKNRRSRA